MFLTTQPSVDFLELHAFLVVVVTRTPFPADKAVLFHSDNTPPLYALLNKVLSSDHMMLLICSIILFCMAHNIKILAKHIRGANNKFCDLLNQFKF